MGCADISSHVEKTCDLDASIASGSFKPPCKYALPNGQSIQSYAENSDYFINATQEISINFAVVSSSLTTVETPSMVGTFTNMSILTNVTTDPRCTIHSGNNCGTTNSGSRMLAFPMRSNVRDLIRERRSGGNRGQEVIWRRTMAIRSRRLQTSS